MGEQGKIAWAAASALAVVVLGGVVILLAGALVWVARGDEPMESDLAAVLDMYIDGEIDAGFHDSLADIGADPLMKSRKVLLMHDVNTRTAKDVAARLLHLDALDPEAPIDLYIATAGGWVESSFAIIDTIRLIEAPVNTWALGGCYSSGTMILAAGTGRRRATEDSILMVHANDVDAEAEAYSYDPLTNVRFERAWRAMSNLPEEWFPLTEEAMYYLSPEQAMRFEIIDEIVPMWDVDFDAGDGS